MKRIVLLFNSFEEEHIGKDVFLVPYYLAKANNMDVTIVYPPSKTNKNLPTEIRGVKLQPFNFPFTTGGRKLFVLLSFFYLLFNAVKIDVLLTFHLEARSSFIIKFYKLINRNGKVYLKMDIPIFIINKAENILNSTNILGFFDRLFYLSLFENVDVFSCETKLCYDRLLQWKYSDSFSEKLVLMQNGFDDEEREKLNIKINNFEEKDNLIITVGRLGTNQKNTEMFLDSLIGLDLKNWKVKLIGKIEPSFRLYIDEYFKNNPTLINKVEFVGVINDKVELWNYYNKAKVFVLTSRWESYGLVLNEAKRFNNFIISTNVGIANEIISNDTGCLIDNESSISLKNKLLEIFNDEIKIDVFSQPIEIEELFWCNLIKRIKI